MANSSKPAWTIRQEREQTEAKRNAPRQAGDPSFDDLLSSFDFDPDMAQITLNGERMVLTDNRSLGMTRSELIAALGYEKARGLATRIGYNLGSNDAYLGLELRKTEDVFSGYMAGPQLHSLKGSVKVETLAFKVDHAKGEFYSEAYWHNSAECLAHRDHVGIGPYPAGWQQTGYASGYASGFFGRPMIFRELQCVAMGHEKCLLVGKPAEDWENAEEELRWFRAENYSARHLDVDPADAGESETAAPAGHAIVGASTGFNLALHLLDRVAPTDAPVLFTGESGVGKEVFARELHRRSRRADRLMVSVNCAAIPDTLIEAELFGVEKGAFTGADSSRPGRFERARGSTLFLDEIGTLSLSAQAKLLRVLQDGEYERVGGSTALAADVRVVAATNVDLRKEVEEGRFRADLLHRITTFPISLPPLRERQADIPLLANHFLRQKCRIHGRRSPGFDDAAIRHLQEYSWPGNVREMQNLIERAVILANDGDLIGIHHLTMMGSSLAADQPIEPFWEHVLSQTRGGHQAGLKQRLLASGLTKDQVVDSLIEAALEKNDGNISKAAAEIGMTRSQINYWLKLQTSPPR